MEPNVKSYERLPGSAVGNYTIVAEMGRGSTGVVYRAQPIDGGDEVALKVMNQVYAGHPSAELRFLREARVAATLTHPSAANVVDFGSEDDVLFLAMTLLEGQSLRSWLRKSDDTSDDRPDEPETSSVLCPVADLIAIGSQVADVLAAAHQVDLIHRDIKPENVFILDVPREDGSPDVRVLDFGLAFISEHDGSLGRLTQEGILGGTPAYMSPEQAQAEPLTAASDVYSLGCVLYELVCGDVPFVGSVPETLARHVYMAAKPLAKRDIARPVPEQVMILVESMLAKHSAKRPSPKGVAMRLRNIRLD